MDMRVVSRREFLRLGGIVGGGILLAACRPTALQPTAETQPTAAQPTEAQPTEAPTSEGVAEREPVTIEFWSPMGSEEHKKYVPMMVEEYQSMYPWVTVEYELTGGPPGGGDFIEGLLAHVASGNPPDCAMMWTPATQYAVRGVLFRIDDFMANAKYAYPGAFYDAVMGSCGWQGGTYALPAAAADTGMFISIPKFEEKGISPKREDFPKTWDELKELSGRFTVWEGDLLKTAGHVPWASSYYWPAWVASNGGKFYDQVANSYDVLDSENNVEWLTYLVNWLDEEYRGDIEKVNQSGSWGYTGDNSSFNLGNAAMADDGAWMTTLGHIPFPFEVAPYPVGPSGTKSYTFWWANWMVVLNGAKHPYEAFLFNEYYATLGWRFWYENVAPEILPWKDAPPDMHCKALADVVGEEKSRDMEAFYKKYLAEAAAECWNSPIEDYAGDVIRSAADEALHKVKEPAQALADARALCQAKLDEVMGSL
jgi:multiple sugar transport system substrate-binding protein